MSLTKDTSDASLGVCVFCNNSEDNEFKYGKLYHNDGITTHYFCLLLSSNMEQRGRDDEGILGFLTLDIRNEMTRGKKLICCYCKRKGATLGCCNIKCPKSFHLPCGLLHKSFHLFYGEFKSYCVQHRPRDTVRASLSKVNENFHCNICYDDIDKTDMYGNLLAPCCRETALFHRNCIQKFALTAGYFFKCPLCNNKKVFRNSMIKNGIFIPSQDAAWELEPDAFQELLYKHDRCDADNCICPAGRYFTTNDNWQLIICNTCASQGIHVECGRLHSPNSIWNCEECTSILNRSNGIEDSKAEEDYLSCFDERNLNEHVDSLINSLCIDLRSSFRSQMRSGPRCSKVKLFKGFKRIYCANRRKLLRSIAIRHSPSRQGEEIGVSSVPIDQAIRSLSSLLSSSERESSQGSSSIYVEHLEEDIENVQLPSILPPNSSAIPIKNIGSDDSGDLAQLPVSINSGSSGLPGTSKLNSTVNILSDKDVRVAGSHLQEKSVQNMRVVAESLDTSVDDTDKANLVNFVDMFFSYYPAKLLRRET